MRLDATAVAELCVSLSLRSYLRLTPMKYAATPLGLGYGETRFASASKSFKVLYIAKNLATGVAETTIRDRFVDRATRRLTEEEIETWGITEVESVAPLLLVDLRTTGPLFLGVPTDVVRAKSHRQGRRFSEALYPITPMVDGILYQSRLTSEICVAVYDRGVAKLKAGPLQPVIQQAALIPALAALNVQILAKKALPSP